jgi:hypothetical protein
MLAIADPGRHPGESDQKRSVCTSLTCSDCRVGTIDSSSSRSQPTPPTTNRSQPGW